MSHVKFIHLRNTNDFDDFLKQKDSLSVKGGTTIAFIENDDGSIRLAVAKCHERDNFCRRTGRVKSAGRLNSDKLSTVLSAEQIAEHDSPYEAILEACGF